MPRRHPALPTLWLMTDERQGDALWPALAALPRGSGVVFRHHRTAELERGAIYARLARIARRRGLVLTHETLAPLRVHFQRPVPGVGKQPPWIARAHSLAEALTARRAGAIAIFVSAIFPNRTHPGVPALGPLRAIAIANAARLPAIALGGMTGQRFRRLRALGFYGWAAIDGLTATPRRWRNQKRNAVPT